MRTHLPLLVLQPLYSRLPKQLGELGKRLILAQGLRRHRGLVLNLCACTHGVWGRWWSEVVFGGGCSKGGWGYMRHRGLILNLCACTHGVWGRWWSEVVFGGGCSKGGWGYMRHRGLILNLCTCTHGVWGRW